MSPRLTPRTRAGNRPDDRSARGSTSSGRSSPGQVVRWGLIGASTIAGDYIVDAIRADAGSVLAAIAGRDDRRSEALARAHDVPIAYRRIDELLEDGSLDAVYVSSTNDRHAAEAIAAAEAGKHVLCEKPLALSVADALAVRSACERAGVVLGVNHHLRCAPAHRTVRQLVADGAIGRILGARVAHAMHLDPRRRTWRVADASRGAGVVLDLTVHDADLLRFLLRDEVEDVLACTAQQGMASGAIEDAVMGVMRFAGGALASFHDAFTVPHAETCLEIHGATGSIVVRDAMVSTPTARVCIRRGVAVEQVRYDEVDGLHARAVREFASAVRGDGLPAATGEDGQRSVAIALAVLESASRGVRVRPATPEAREGRA